MLEAINQSQILQWERKVSQREPFLADDIWNVITDLYIVHERSLVTSSVLTLLRNKFLYYQLGYYPGDPESNYAEEQYDQFNILYAKHVPKFEKKAKRLRASGEDMPKQPMFSFDPIFESLNLRKKPEEIVISRYYSEGAFISPSSGTAVNYASGEHTICNNEQNGRNFGLNLARNLLHASDYTLRNKN